jgi:PAS domain S-box-containing protein
MQFQYTPYILPLISAALISGGVAYYAWTRRSRSVSAIALAFLAIAIAEWSLGYALEIAGANLQTKLFFGKSEYLGIAFAPLMWLIFAINHSNRGKNLTPRMTVLLAIIPLITVLLAFTTEVNRLIWGGYYISQSGDFSALGVTHGLWFWVHSAYSYLLLLIGTIIIGLRSIWRKQGIYRRQATVLLIAVLAPWVGNILYLSGKSPISFLDLTPFAFTLTVVALAWAVFGFQLIDLTPIARDMVVENMGDGMIVIDSQGKIADINNSALNIMRLTTVDIIGKQALDILNPWSNIVNRYVDILEARDEISIGEGDAKQWFELFLTPIRDRRKDLIGRVITLRDITKRKHVEERFDQLSRQQRIILDNIPVGVMLQKTHQIVWGNRLAETLTGYSANDIQNFESLIYHSDEKGPVRFADQVDRRLARGESASVEFPLKQKDGTVIWVNVIGRAINPPNLDDEILWVVQDVTGRRQTDEQLRLRWRALEASPASIVITDSEGRIQYVNPKFVQVTGYTLDESVGQNPRILKSELTPPDVHRQLWETIKSGKEWRGEFCNRKKNGDLYWELASISSISDSDGNITHFVAIKEDITEQRKLREQLRQRNESLSILHQFTVDLLDIREMDKLLYAIVDRLAQLMDAPYSKILLREGDRLIVKSETKNLLFMHNEQLDRKEGKLSWQAFDTKEPVVVEDYSSSLETVKNYGQTLIHSVAEIPIITGGLCVGVLSLGRSIPSYVFDPEQMETGVLFGQLVGLVLDNANLYNSALMEIAERKRTEALLQESEVRYRQIVESASDIIYRTDSLGFFTYVNPTAYLLMGFKSDDEVLGRHFTELASSQTRNRLKRFYERQYLKGETNTYFEFPALTSTGQEIWLGQNVQIIREGGKIIGFQAVARNINDIKQAQDALAIARDQALEASRLKSKLLASVSHELRTPLSGILGYAELLHNDSFGPLVADQKNAVSNIIQSANYLTTMINELLDEAQIEAKTLILKMEPCSPRAILDGIEASMKILARNKGLILETLIDQDIPNTLICDERRLKQILINLIGNAIKFTKKGDVKVRLFKPSPSGWAIKISDTGIGISDKEQVRIFEPFHKVDDSMTGDNRGTGLGLSITKQLIDLMDGQIKLESKIGKGSTFTISLPLIENKSEHIIPKPFALIVEDDPHLVKIFEAVLKESGFETESDTGGNLVMEIMSRRKPSLVILDLHLPFATGIDILHKIRADQEWINTPVIVTTADLYLAKSLRDQVEEILIKPVSISKLREVAIRLRMGNTKKSPVNAINE